jgi:hypothetical protein
MLLSQGQQINLLLQALNVHITIPSLTLTPFKGGVSVKVKQGVKV